LGRFRVDPAPAQEIRIHDLAKQIRLRRQRTADEVGVRLLAIYEGAARGLFLSGYPQQVHHHPPLLILREAQVPSDFSQDGRRPAASLERAIAVIHAQSFCILFFPIIIFRRMSHFIENTYNLESKPILKTISK
jgi:hypothetical protein